MSDTQEYRWTAKLPALLAGGVLFVMGLLVSRRYWPLGVVLLVVAAGLFIYAGTVRSWCAPVNATYGHLAWGGHEWHEPSLLDCFNLIYR